MKKRLIVFLIVLIAASVISGCAATRPVPESEREVVKVRQAPNIAAEELQNNAVIWFAKNFQDSRKVIELNDKESNVVIANGIVEFPFGLISVPALFTVTIEFKDGRYRSEWTDFRASYTAASPNTPFTTEAQVNGIKEQVEKLEKSLFDYLTTENIETDW